MILHGTLCCRRSASKLAANDRQAAFPAGKGFIQALSHIQLIFGERQNVHLFALEHGEKDYRADVALYSVAAVALTTYLLLRGQPYHLSETGAPVLLGLVGWTLMEYVLHRFVLHGLHPFRRWHAEHHKRPAALIFTPTIVSATLIATLVFLPALLKWNLRLASALTLGVVVGYLAYTLTHHATHHWPADNAWLKRRKRWHALHHYQVAGPICYGVTTSFWDQVFGTTNRARQVRIDW